MVLEINQVVDGEVQARRDAAVSGNTRVPSDPLAASSPNSLRTTRSWPSDLSCDNRPLVVRSTAPRPPASASSQSMKLFFKRLTWRKVSRSATDGEINPPEVSTDDNTKGEERFRWTSPCVDHKVYGFEEELQALESFVRRENDRGFRAVAVVGAGGIGKTTLCQLLFNENGIMEEFVPRIWVSNSRLPAEDQDELQAVIVRRMLTQIGEDETDDMDLDRLMAMLHRNLWGKKYLIILDDARDADPWYYNLDAVPNMDDDWKNRLAYGLPKGSGGRVVVTGRNEEVARKMVGEHNLQKVIPLSHPDYCWSIFEEAVGPGLDEVVKNNGTSLDAMKRDVYEKSAGIPLAIKIMGQIMKEQLREASEKVIERTATA